MRDQTITPVRPMPPSVASNRPFGEPGSSVCSSPSALISPIASTWLPNVPAVPWFLPWMSLAIAPPTVTCWVPGTTGTISPRGTTASRSSPIVAPAYAVTVRRLRSSSTPLSNVMSMATPPVSWAASP